MGTATLTDLDAIFKRDYDEGSDVLREQQNLKAQIWGKFKVSSIKPSPQGIFTPVSMAGNEAGGAINENETFQDPQPMKPVQPKIVSKLVVWPFQVSGSVIRQSESDKVAFAKGLDATQQDSSGRIFSDLNRQSLGTGTGQITLANGSGSATTSLVVDDPFSFREEMYIESFASLGGAKEIGATTAAKITAINYDTYTLTLSTSQTWSDDSIICKKGVMDGVTDLASAKEITGWRAICDTTTYSTTFENVVVADYGQWKGNVINASSSPVSQDFLQRSYNRTAVIGGDKPDTLLSNYGQARTFLNTELDKTRYEPGTVKGGAIVLKWGALEWMVDHTYPIGEIGMMCIKDLQKFQTRDVHLSNLPGYSLYQVVGKDAVGGYYCYQGNLGTWKRNNQTRCINLTEPTF